MLALATSAMMLPVFACAQATSKPSPSPSASFCLNKATGAVRDVLINSAGMPQPCHKNEIGTSLAELQVLEGGPVPSPSASPGPTATPGTASCEGCVVDSTGKEVGPLSENSDPDQGNLVLVTVNGVAMALPVAQGSPGWVGGLQTGAPLALFYPTTDCSGQGYIPVSTSIGANDQPLQVVPLVEVNDGQGGPYIFGTTVWYPQPPFSIITANSIQTKTDPSQGGDCSPLQSSQAFFGGPPASGSLLPLGTPPFNVQ